MNEFTWYGLQACFALAIVIAAIIQLVIFVVAVRVNIHMFFVFAAMIITDWALFRVIWNILGLFIQSRK